jgi:hypothetical protein
MVFALMTDDIPNTRPVSTHLFTSDEVSQTTGPAGVSNAPRISACMRIYTAH